MNLPTNIYTANIQSHFETFFKATERDLIIIAPFLSIEGVEFIYKNIKKDVKVTVLFSLQADYLVSGYTDINAIQLLQSKNATISFVENLHAKCFIRDASQIIIGSSNVTNAGMNIGHHANVECIQITDVKDDFAQDFIGKFNALQLSIDHLNELKDLSTKAKQNSIKVEKTSEFKALEDFIKKLKSTSKKQVDFISHCVGNEFFYADKHNRISNGTLSYGIKESKQYNSLVAQNSIDYKYAIPQSDYNAYTNNKIAGIVFRLKAQGNKHEKDILIVPFKKLLPFLDYANKLYNIYLSKIGDTWYLSSANKDNNKRKDITDCLNNIE